MNSRRRQNLVAKLMAAQYGRCYWCGQGCVQSKLREAEKAAAKREKRNARQEATLDHLWPVGHPRRNKDRVMACRPCNQKRGNPADHLLFSPEAAHG